MGLRRFETCPKTRYLHEERSRSLRRTLKWQREEDCRDLLGAGCPCQDLFGGMGWAPRRFWGWNCIDLVACQDCQDPSLHVGGCTSTYPAPQHHWVVEENGLPRSSMGALSGSMLVCRGVVQVDEKG